MLRYFQGALLGNSTLHAPDNSDFDSDANAARNDSRTEHFPVGIKVLFSSPSSLVE